MHCKSLPFNRPPQPDLTVVVPVYKNATTLKKLYHCVDQTLNDADIHFELLFVNDASPDHSLHIICDMQSKHSNISLLHMRQNVGQHAAVLHGLRFARGQCCIVMDADLQDPPRAITILWNARSPEYQAIFAGRQGHYQNISRMITSKLYKIFLYFLTGLPKNAGIFVLMERPLVDMLLKMPVVLPWINVMVGLSGVSILSVPVTRLPRKEGASAYSNWGRFRSALLGLYCVLVYKIWKPKQSYLENLKNDPVAWVKTMDKYFL